MSKDLKDTVKEVSDKVDTAIDQGKDTLKDTADKAKDSLHDFKNDAKDSYHDLKNDAKDSFHDLKNKANDHFSGFQGKAEDFAATAEDEFNRLYGDEGKLESMVNFVRDRPFLSLGVAALVGIVLTKMIRCCGHK
ncbi:MULTISPECIES: DUF883 family protein [Commensalibacter]|uniref:General stress protein n=2 Tax=Commensalibacter TaxID=1079922 RepID=A0ABN8W9T7_9PROT|nr:MULTISPECIES: hypothetical protein [Commensalibacter]EUK18200.1 putative general stress response protein [Commensalibacter papalotli (ex Servin-Garciduenas et al. 2014)]CAI3937806.1 unnamed protein product [Commensalibacter papalotli (ex Botero et al. 2024)]CAI3937833.1 unnamed protein product [Commensalibacter papalotli (ex Botero et al. 2024)]